MLGGTTYGHAFDITPSDSANVVPACHGIYVGATGNVTVETLQGTTVTFTGVPTGTTLPVQVRKVKSTGTTASLLLGLVA